MKIILNLFLTSKKSRKKSALKEAADEQTKVRYEKQNKCF